MTLHHGLILCSALAVLSCAGCSDDDGADSSDSYDPSVCDPPDGFQAKNWSVWAAESGDCVNDIGLGTHVVETPEQLEALLDCDPALAAPDIDFTQERLVFFSVTDNPDPVISSVGEIDGMIQVTVQQPAYCGGAQPGSPAFRIRLAASELPVSVFKCSYGSCNACSGGNCAP